MPQAKTALILMCAPPRHGSSRSRLASAIGSRLACLIEHGVLHCALEDLLSWPGRRLLAVEAGDVAWAEQAIGHEAEVLVQPAGSFGRRLMALDSMLRVRGDERLIFLGTDAPAMNAVCLAMAAAALARRSSVIGATPDGRIALLGTARGWPTIDDLQSSRVTASSRMAARCRKAGHDLAFVNPGVSVSCVADLTACRRELEGDPRQARVDLHVLLAALATDIPGRRLQPLEAQAEACDPAVAQTRTSIAALPSPVV